MSATRRRQPVVLFAAILALQLLGWRSVAADAVSGYVIDAVRDQRVADVEVAFLIPAGDTFSEMVRRTSDADGAFEFSGPFLTAGAAFSLQTRYRGVDYSTETLIVGDQDRIILEVYDGTQDDDDIRVEAHHLFLSVTPEAVEVAQLVHVGNHGDATYVGRTIGDERRVLEFALPPGNLALQGHAGDVVRASANRVFDTRPLPPGDGQVAFTFRLQGEGFDGDYEHEVLYPTQRLDLFIQPTTASLGPLFQDLGETVLHDQPYRHYRLENLVPGRTVTVPLPFSKPLRWALKWTMLALIPAVVAAALALARAPDGPQRLTDAQRAGLEQRRQSLLAELVRFEARGDDSEDSQQTRRRVEAEAVDVYRRLGLGG